MMKKLLASSLLAAFLVFSGAALAHPAGQGSDTSKTTKSGTDDKSKDKGKKGKGKTTKKPAKKGAADTSSTGSKSK
jgi:hypothetical protein